MVLYVVIFAAVKEAIDKSVVGQILIKKYGAIEKIETISDGEIEKELGEDESR